MPDIFSRDVSNLAGVFTADRAKLTFRNGILNTLAQQVQFSYSQAITRLYEVGSSNIYYVGGRTQGQASLNRVVGPASTVCEIYRLYGDVCEARENVLTIDLEETDCSSGLSGRSTYVLSFCVITGVGISVAAQDMIINESTTLMYGSLSCHAG
jgi:hypothetical protein